MAQAALELDAAVAPQTRPGRPLPDGCTIRAGRGSDAARMLALIDANREAGHLLPRTLDDLMTHAPRFLVVEREGRLIGCAELAPLSPTVAEVRSLVVDAAERGQGLGSLLVAELGARARREGFATLCAFTHQPAHFVRLGFSIVPHVWLQEKIAHDCTTCVKFRVCGQYAMVLPLGGRLFARAPLRMARVGLRAAAR
jgi:amino-acid N-acetyltransferase